ncbi:hypothetical protein [Burkholderia contaminans]|uniref:hypothetical protein n=1 Tax=Burkholderia contaminans TaxID=488447 RepID=UPI00158E9F4E|nr:hypothetical protein [Burkholderia contaminans]
MKYDVEVVLDASRVATITVEADSEEDAEDAAYEIAISGEVEWEDTAWQAGDIEIVNIEENEDE